MLNRYFTPSLTVEHSSFALLISHMLAFDYRFHLLAEFDDGKRSCRKRLAGHNERRRKPHTGIHSVRTEKLFQSYDGILQYLIF